MKNILTIISISVLTFACTPKIKISEKTMEKTMLKPNYKVPAWSKNAVIYEVNIRQYTPEGTIKAFQKHLPRLKDLGVDILWLMPIFPVGLKNRKGGMGSPYSVRNYTEVNPDFGTNADFEYLIKEVHRLGMKLILDWVPNHSSFDNPWVTLHPEWYTKDSLGQITHPQGTDWTDVADLNYDNAEMRKEMTASMLYWISKFDVDGFRCDVAGWVPNDFWLENNTALQSKKHVFLLAEWEDPALDTARFHATYGWELHHIMNEIAKGKMKPASLDTFLQKDTLRFSEEDYRMNFITNHDENSWNGTIAERMGDAGDAFAVLMFTLDGFPLIYGGQEANLNKRLSFFEKDQIDWSDKHKLDFYKKLIALKHENEALWNGAYGGSTKHLDTDNPFIYAYSREKNGQQVIVVLNLSNKTQSFQFTDFDSKLLFKRLFVDLEQTIQRKDEMLPWSYKIYFR